MKTGKTAAMAFFAFDLLYRSDQDVPQRSTAAL
jgi:hypothetical protein